MEKSKAFVRSLFIGTLLVLLLISHAEGRRINSRKISGESSRLQFVLVHGGGHGCWCWYKIRALMETSGYNVTCFDFKGAGIDLTDPNNVTTFEEYNEPLLDFLSNLPHNHRVILVGHSLGGFSLTYAIHHFAKKIQLAIYIAANMLEAGFQTPQDLKDGQPDLSRFGVVADLEFKNGLDHPPTSRKIKPEFQREIFYNLSPLEDSTLASMLLRPTPVQAFSALQFTPAPDSDSVPRVYIKTKYDQVYSQTQQDAMIRRWPPAQVYTLDSDHSAFFSAPLILFGYIANAAESLIS